MAKGRPGADSSALVTKQIQGRTLIDLATDLFGTTPMFWGRYFTSVSATGTVEYRHLKENQVLRDKNIRVLPIARQTKHVNGSQALGSADAEQNVEDLILTFGEDYLKSQGGRFLLVLDVEGAPSLSLQYYTGWAQSVISHSQDFTDGDVTLLPCVYATQGDNPTWHAIADAQGRGAECHGAWVARWRIRGCGSLPDFDNSLVLPSVQLPCPVLIWQYADECHGGDGFDCNETNPAIDVENDLLQRCILPPDMAGIV
jgi:hypothetical protein